MDEIEINPRLPFLEGKSSLIFQFYGINSNMWITIKQFQLMDLQMQRHYITLLFICKQENLCSWEVHSFMQLAAAGGRSNKVPLHCLYEGKMLTVQ